MPKKKKVNLGFAARLEPRDAIAYFEAKGHKISFDWWEVEARAHAQAFTVAHAARLDVLETIRKETRQIFTEGMTEREFVKALEPRLRAKGWWGKQILVDGQGGAKQVQLGSAHRLKTIYRTNKRTAYNAGIWKQQKERADSRPYWMYVAVMDSKTRPRHAALNGKVFHHDDPIWGSIYPPNGFGCRCRVRDLSEHRLKRLGLQAESSDGHLHQIDQRLGVDKFTGEEIRRPGTQYRFKDPLTGDEKTFTPDPGWSYNPGENAFGTDIELMRKLNRVPDQKLRSQVIQLMNDNPARHRAYSLWAEGVLDKHRPGHGARAIGLVDEDIADFVRKKTKAEPARILVLGEKQLTHADATKHHEKGVALTRGEYLNLPKMIAAPQAVLWDTDNENLLYVFGVEGGAAIKVVVESPVGHKARRQLRVEEGALDVAINTYRVPVERLKTEKQYEVVREWKK